MWMMIAAIQPGTNISAPAIAMALGRGLRQHGEHGRRRAVQHGRAEPAHQPQHEPGPGQHAQVLQVLDDGEAGADGESELGGIDRKADAPPENQVGDECGLDGLFDRWRDEPAGWPARRQRQCQRPQQRTARRR